MDSLLIFVVGYTLGAKAGNKGFEEVLASIRIIRESEEFKGMLSALRSHVGFTLRELAELVAKTDGVGMEDVLERARRLAGQVDPRSRAS